MLRYTAKMQHNEDTIRRLVETQYGTFQFGKKLLRLVLAVGMIAFGVFGSSELVSPTVCLIFGCILLTGLNTRARYNAKKICTQMKGDYPKSDYSFDDKDFRFYDKGEPIPYSNLIRLVEDKEYMYLYISRESAYMVEKASVSDDGAEGLKALLEKASGLKWTKPVTLMNFGFRSLMGKRKKDDYEGYRLK